MGRIKVFISTSSFAKFSREPIDLMTQAGCICTVNPHGRVMAPQELWDLAADAEALLAGTEKLDENVLSRLPHLKVISRCGVGTDNIDQQAVRTRKIKVYNTPDAPTAAVAELTMGLILNLLRDIPSMSGELKSGRWNKRMGFLLSGKRVGIIGYGRIGRKVAELLKAFGCSIKVFDPYLDVGQCGAELTDLKCLLAWADIITVHVSSQQLILGKDEMEHIKEGTWLVNTSRGGVVDEQALYTALTDRHLAGAALDVYQKEPYEGPLAKLDNVLLTPHVGSYAREARIHMEVEAARNLITGIGK